MTRARTAELIDMQAKGCAALWSPLYSALLTHVADDVRAGGPCALATDAFEGEPGRAAIALRFLGAVHALVLTGQAPDLARHYPSVGGDATDPDSAWPAFRSVVADNLDHLAEWMRRPPQTNEVGRANMLITGLLLALADLPEPVPVRLFELGTSAGLNLRASHFRVEAAEHGFAWGAADSPVVLDNAWQTPPPAGVDTRTPLAIIERRGCDVDPLDPLDPAGALTLRAYVWPDHPDRAARLDGAMALARRVPANVDRIGAGDFLADVHPVPGTLTVVWHSVMRQYVPREEWSRVESHLARLTAESSPTAGWFAHLAFEPRRVGEGSAHFTLTYDDTPLAQAHPWGLLATGISGGWERHRGGE